MAKVEPLHIDIRPHIAAVARPGDTVLIGFNRELDDLELAGLAEDFSNFTDQTGVHIATLENVSSMVVIRPEGDSDGE
jgi:hypothetical protein